MGIAKDKRNAGQPSTPTHSRSGSFVHPTEKKRLQTIIAKGVMGPGGAGDSRHAYHLFVWISELGVDRTTQNAQPVRLVERFI